MQRLALTSMAAVAAAACFVAPARSADLDGPYYRESDVIIERPAPPMLRERIIERYYVPAPPAYYAPRAYVPDAYYDDAPPADRAPYVDSRSYGGGCGWYHRRAFYGDRPYGWRRHCWH